jgi:hypothetical protein
MSFLRKYFNKRIKMLGRAGLVYKTKDNKYFVDSEVLVGPPYDVVIFADGVRYYGEEKKQEILSNEERQSIIKAVKAELESMGMSVQVG